MYYHRRHSSSPRRCSYCNSLEHDKRRCGAWSSDADMLKRMVRLDCQIYIDTLIDNTFVPTSVLHLNEMDAYIFDHQAGQWQWNTADVGNVLFTLSRKDDYYRQPFTLDSSSRRMKREWEVTPLNTLGLGLDQQAQWHKTTLSFQDIFEAPPELQEARREVERCILNNSYSEDRSKFVTLMNNLIGVYTRMSNDGETCRLKTEKIDVVSSVDRRGAEEYYNGIHYKIQKNSIDKFLPAWYKHYNSKIKDNHFQK